jgi:hypothetical protein
MRRPKRGLAGAGPLSVLLLELLRAEPSPAGDALDVAEGPGFVVVRGAGAIAETACAPSRISHAALIDVVQQAQRRRALDAPIAVVFTSDTLSCGGLFYVPVANDVRGIGYAHERASEVFDESPDSALEGIAFLNDWPYWESRDEELQRAFKHEIGHRWGARVRASIDDAASADLLGRQLMHWSFFLDTGGSPLEGNAWQAAEGGAFRTLTDGTSADFSMLDLYLMGAASAAEVEPFTLLRPVDPEALAATLDCHEEQLGPASPPERCGSLTLAASATAIAIDDVIRVEGERAPGPVAHQTHDVAVIVLESERAPLTLESCRLLDSALQRQFDAFEQATQGRVSLRNITSFHSDCESVSAAPLLDTPRGCALSARPAPALGWNDPLALALCGASVVATRLRRRARRRSTAASR